jgi:hypothetical protein
LACLLPLVLAGYLVHAMKQTISQDDAVVTEFLVADLASVQVSHILRVYFQ